MKPPILDRRLRYAAMGVILLVAAIATSQPASALLAGNQMQIGWTGGTPFGAFVVNGLGTAAGTYNIPMGGGFFSTSPYASSTDMRTSVQDTNINITNNAFGFGGPQWFEYLDINNTLPDFRNLTIALDAANTTASFNFASQVQVQENAIAVEFSTIASSKAVSINVTPEPATISVLGAAGVVMHLITGRRRRG